MNIYSKYDGGHRLSYISTFEKEFSSKRKTLKQSIFSKDTLFFLMVEECFFTYIIVSILRSLFMLKTAGLIFRVIPTIRNGGWRMKCKYYILKFSKKSKYITNISIVPFYVDKKISKIADNWIYDPQLWDLKQEEFDYFNEANKEKTEKGIVSLIGSQNRLKGFGFLMENLGKFEKELKFFFLGKLDEEMTILYSKKEVFENIDGINRFVTDQEIIRQYALSDYIWCHYDESYDQASGIFGRAVQLGAKVIIRPNTVLESFCIKEDISYGVFEFSNDRIHVKYIQSGTSYVPKEWRDRAKKYSKMIISDVCNT